MRVPDEFRECVVFIGVPKERDGQVSFAYRATAFMVAVRSEKYPEAHCIYLVTARHVATHLVACEFVVRINTTDGSSALITCTDVKWWYHPFDESVDVAVLCWEIPNNMQCRYLPLEMFLSDEVIATHHIGVGDDVVITGLFTHFSGSLRNVPIIRLGNIAMMPAENIPMENNWSGPSAGDFYLIEARSIGGLSGSPVFVRQMIPADSFSWRQTLYLLGLIHGHWEIPKGSENTVPTDDGLPINMGIAMVVPARKILEVIHQKELKDMRTALDHRTDSNPD